MVLISNRLFISCLYRILLFDYKSESTKYLNEVINADIEKENHEDFLEKIIDELTKRSRKYLSYLKFALLLF